MRDKNDAELKNGDVIDIHQTVNGENLFVILDVADWTIKYARNLEQEYEYDKHDLLNGGFTTGEVEFEIVSNIYNYLNSLR